MERRQLLGLVRCVLVATAGTYFVAAKTLNSNRPPPVEATTPSPPTPPLLPTSCAFDTLPGFPFYWDPDCTETKLGCKADSHSVQCRFCGEPPYDSIACPHPSKYMMSAMQGNMPTEAAWIVVGGGAAGCAAAAALADAGEDVLVLERGLSDRQVPATEQAGTWPYVVNTEATQHIRWQEGVWGTAAKVLGGGTSINGGYSFEESPDWLRKAFGPDLDLDALYKSSSYLAGNLASPVQANRFGLAWKDALCQSGFGCADPTNPRLRHLEGAWVPMCTINTSAPGLPRRGAAVLLHERAHMKNLRVMTSSTVHRVIFNGTKAIGVRVSLNPAQPWWPRYPVDVRATKGVIVAAGAIFTPQLLQLSGIGESDLLKRLGVKPVVPDLPVGKNFIDRLVMNLAFRAPHGVHMPFSIGPVIALNSTLNMTIEVEAGGSINSEFAIASLALDKPEKREESLRGFMTSLMRYPNQQPSALADTINNGMDMLVLQHEAHSRGWIKAVSLDPSVPPKVAANYWADHRDYVNQWRGIQELLKIAGSEAMRNWVGKKVEVALPQDVLTKELKCALLGDSYRGTGAKDSPFAVIPCLPLEPAGPVEWGLWLQEHHVSSYHYFGTAAFGTVVEGGEFTVKGTEGLHVVDASVFPDPTRINPQHMIMTLGHYVGSRLARQAAGSKSQPATSGGETTP